MALDLDNFIFVWLNLAHISSLVINVLLLILIIYKKLYKTLDIQLVLLISITDTTISVVNLTYVIIKHVLDIQLSSLSNFYCQLIGIITSMMDDLSFIFIGLLAFERYQLLCNQTQFPKKVYIITSAVLILIALTLALVAGFRQEYRITPTGGYCTLNPETKSIFLYFQFLLFNSVLLLIVYFYIRITIKTLNKIQSTLYKNRIRILPSESDNALNQVNYSVEQVTKDQIEVIESQKTVVIFKSMTFCLCYISIFLPNLISWWVMIISSHIYSSTLNLVTLLTYSWIQAVNPMLALFLHSTIYNHLKMVF